MKISTLLPGPIRIAAARFRRAASDTKTALRSAPRPVASIRDTPHAAPSSEVAAPRPMPLPDQPVTSFERPTNAATTPAAGAFLATLRGGATWSILPGDTVLSAARRARVRLPCSCTMGGCGACKVRLITGKVDLPEHCCLTDDERDAGHILTCVATPRANLVIALPSAQPPPQRGTS